MCNYVCCEKSISKYIFFVTKVQLIPETLASFDKLFCKYNTFLYISDAQSSQNEQAGCSHVAKHSVVKSQT